MTLDGQKAHFANFTQKQSDLLLKKGNDYASEDRLSNFKVGAAICQLSPAQQCLTLIATKVARLGVLLSSGKVPNNESIRDNVIDLANYSVLLDSILEDMEKDKISK